MDRHALFLEGADQGQELRPLHGVLEAVVVVAEDGGGIRLVGEAERVGDEVGTDDLGPQRAAQHVRAVAVGDGLVDDVPGLHASLVAADDGVDVFAHAGEQFLAGGARAVVAAEAAAETRAGPGAAGCVGARGVVADIGDRGGIGRSRGNGLRDDRGGIGAGEDPVRGLAVPDQGMADDLHAVGDGEVHEGVRAGEVVAVPSLAGMDQLPLHVVLRGDLVELRLHQRHLGGDLLRRASERCAADVAAVEGGADREVFAEHVLEGRRRFGSHGGRKEREEKEGEGSPVHGVGVGVRRTRRPGSGLPERSVRRREACQLLDSLRTLKTKTLIPLRSLTLPLSASTTSGRASVQA